MRLKSSSRGRGDAVTMDMSSAPESEPRIAGLLREHGTRTSFIWATAEAIALFLVPDIPVGATAVVDPRRWWRPAVAAMAGSVVGGLAMYGFASAFPDAADALISLVPGIPDRMVEEAGRALDASGSVAVVGAPFRGIPYKVYVVGAAERSEDLARFLLWTIPSRAIRMVPISAGCALARLVWTRVLGWSLRSALVLYAAVWVAIYLVYFTVVAS